MSSRSSQAPADVRRRLKDVAAACACWGVRLAARRITQFYDAQLTATGLSIAQFGLLTHVASSDDDTLGALAERAGLDPSTLTRNLQALEREGLVEIAAVEGDQRRRSAWVTEAGLTRLLAAQEAWAAAQAELGRLIPADALAAVTEGAERLGATNET